MRKKKRGKMYFINRAIYLARWRVRHPEKVKAHRAVFVALRNGKLQKKNCFCGIKAEAHHEDYSKPLDIVWLCKFHHKEQDKKNRKKKVQGFQQLHKLPARRNYAIL